MSSAHREDVFVHTSVRCGECHVKMLDEWKTSAHSRAMSSPLYRAARKQAPSKASCDRCHAPLSRYIPLGEPAVAEASAAFGGKQLRRPGRRDEGSDSSEEREESEEDGNSEEMDDFIVKDDGVEASESEEEEAEESDDSEEEAKAPKKRGRK